MEQFLTNLYITNLYPAKAKLLKLAREQRPETKPKKAKNSRKVVRMLRSNDHTEKTLPGRTRRKQLARQAKK